MKIQILSIRDRAVDAFMQPMFFATPGAGIRAFSDEINRQDSSMNKHPEDYDLYHLGEYDDATGKFAGLEAPRQVAIGKDLVASK